MRPFNLDEYLKNPDRKVVTRNGRSARIICTDRKDECNRPILALVEYVKEKQETCHGYNPDGKFEKIDSEYDLFFAPTKHEGWVNVYRSKNGYHYTNGSIYNTEEKAKERINDEENYIDTVKIEWEE